LALVRRAAGEEEETDGCEADCGDQSFFRAHHDGERVQRSGASCKRPSDMADEIPIARPLLAEEEAVAARRVILSGWIMQGPEVEAFEREFAAVVGAPFAAALSSGTAALHVALLAVGVGPGDEVVTVS